MIGTLLGNALDLMAPILLAALGGLLTERAGILNIGLEGTILAGAFAAIAVASLAGSPLAGYVAAVAAGMLISWIFSLACIELRSNIFVAGLATNLLAAGIVPYVSALLFGTKGVVKLAYVYRVASIAGVSVAVPASVAAAIIVAVVLFRTPAGIRLRAAAGDPGTLIARGLDPRRYRRAAILASGAFSGLAGAVMALRLSVFVPNMSAGRGWIALVAIYLGLRHPIGVVVASFVFAIFDAFAGAAQGFSDIPGTLLLGLPYLITLVAMVVYSALGRRSRIEP